MSIALQNKVRSLEERIAVLEKRLLAVMDARIESALPSEALAKLQNDIQGLKMRMGKKEYA